MFIFRVQRGRGAKGSKQKFCCESVDDDWDGLNVKSVLQMGGGSTSGIITGDSDTLGLDILESEVAGERQLHHLLHNTTKHQSLYTEQ